MNKQTILQVNTIPDETEPARRRRVAVAITSLLERDLLLCDEVAALLDVTPDTLNWRSGAPETFVATEFVEL